MDSVTTDWITEVLTEAGVEFDDRRSNQGALWVIGGGELDGLIQDLNDHGADFSYKMDGGRATGGRSGWWMNGYPAKSEPVDALVGPGNVTQEELDSLDVGDVVFHKSFGYGEITKLGGDTISVCFESDKKGGERSFLFPSTFYQGMLQL